jgi:hypothetical protein
VHSGFVSGSAKRLCSSNLVESIAASDNVGKKTSEVTPTLIRNEPRSNVRNDQESVDLVYQVEQANQHVDFHVGPDAGPEEIRKMPLFCIYRECDRIVSIKYSTSTGQDRRFQMKFADERHYSQVLNWVKISGCPIFDQASFRANQRPSGASKPQSARSTSAQISSKTTNTITKRKKTAQNVKMSSVALQTSSLVNLVRDTSMLQASKLGQAGDSMQDTENIAPGTIPLDSITKSSTLVPPSAPFTVNSTQYTSGPDNTLLENVNTRLPPRRELPFSTSESSRPSTGNATTSRPSASTKTVTFDVSRPSTANASIPSPMSHPPSTISAFPTSSPPGLANSTSGSSFQFAALTPASSFPRNPCDAPLANIVSDLAGYRALPDDDRKSILTNSIIKCISDNDFIQLVEDLEGVWERIGIDCELDNRRRG